MSPNKQILEWRFRSFVVQMLTKIFIQVVSPRYNRDDIAQIDHIHSQITKAIQVEINILQRQLDSKDA
jgi:hypothetical protein